MPTQEFSLGDLIANTYDFVARGKPTIGGASRQVATILRRQLRENPRALKLLFATKGI